ncbi:MAG TPA: ABC transporter ATP-binding protein [Chloroflexi bacterium]|nr:ABC transporter ATP-binding protein [Chloroflexota bacterium]
MAATAAISTEDLTKNYGRLVAVDHLSLEVETGEILGFLGPNGAGKTTTMRMLLGLVRPSGGSVRILGMDIEHYLPQILARTGSIIENPTFYPFLSGRDNLRVVARLTGSPLARIEAVLELVDLSSSAKRSFKTYSLGMKQRLAVAAALLNEPDLLILDEPANGLDPAGIVEMRSLMRRLKSQGHTVLISSHVLHEIEQICDRILILNHGKIVVQGKVESLLNARSRIAIRVDRAGEAQAMLKPIDWIEDVSREGDLLLLTAPPDRAADINRLLAGEGLFASEIRPEEESLERFFLDVTEAPKA